MAGWKRKRGYSGCNHKGTAPYCRRCMNMRKPGLKFTKKTRSGSAKRTLREMRGSSA